MNIFMLFYIILQYNLIDYVIFCFMEIKYFSYWKIYISTLLFDIV